MKINFSINTALLIVVLLSSCVDPIAFETEDKNSRIVIFGSFTDQFKDHEVTIRRTGKFGTPGIAMQGLKVEIKDEDGNTAQYYDAGEGNYILPKGEMIGAPGKSYKLIVTLPDKKRHESSWEEMPGPVQIENTYFDIEYRKQLSESNNLIQQFFIDILIDAPLKTSGGDKVYLRWETVETYSLMDLICGPLDNADICYFAVPANYGALNIFKALDDSQEQLKDYKVFSRLPAPYIEFGELHYFVVSQYSISESTYDYWEKIKIVANPTGSIFDKIPASVPGNFSETDGNSEVLGYFEVAAVSVGLTVTTRLDVSEHIQIPQACNTYFPPFLQPDYCCYCFLLPNKIPKPAYWGKR